MATPLLPRSTGLLLETSSSNTSLPSLVGSITSYMNAVTYCLPRTRDTSPCTAVNGSPFCLGKAQSTVEEERSAQQISRATTSVFMLLRVFMRRWVRQRISKYTVFITAAIYTHALYCEFTVFTQLSGEYHGCRGTR